MTVPVLPVLPVHDWISLAYMENQDLKSWSTLTYRVWDTIAVIWGEASIFMLPSKMPFWCFPLNPHTHLWKHQMLNTILLRNTKYLMIRDTLKMLCFVNLKDITCSHSTSMKIIQLKHLTSWFRVCCLSN